MNISNTIYQTLANEWGHQKWWSNSSKLEIMISAILTQNTSWERVEKVIEILKKKKLLEIQLLLNLSNDELEKIIKPVGFYRQKTVYLKEMCKTLTHKFDGSIDNLFKTETSKLRLEMLKWKGFGPETVDTILLYAAKRPVFVIDTYTRRLMNRHGWSNKNDNYDKLAKKFTIDLGYDRIIFEELHALIVQLGKVYCRKEPICNKCPLSYLLKNQVSA